MWGIPKCMFMWFMLEKFIQRISGEKFSQKWSSNLVSAAHSVTTVVLCWWALKEKLSPIVIFVVSTSYFLYDIRNYKLESIYTMHHICAIMGLIHGVNSGTDIPMALTCFLFTEIGNFPLYLVYCLFNHHNKVYLDRWYDIVLKWEFGWFVMFRIIIVSWVLTSAVHPISIMFGCILQFANIKWACGLYDKVRKSLLQTKD
jgi:hypothetical protein